MRNLEQFRIEKRINFLKSMLGSTDYKALKFAEGELSAEEFEPIKQQRKQWREEIRGLEYQLESLKQEGGNK